MHSDRRVFYILNCLLDDGFGELVWSYYTSFRNDTDAALVCKRMKSP